jgi:hypothetical protein
VRQSNHTQKYIPPAFDSSAQIGEPTPPADLGYTSMAVEQGLCIKLCGRLFVKNNSVDLYFTDPKSNDVWLMIKLQDKNGNVLAKSGIIKPGEYIKSVSMLKSITADKTNIKIVVAAFSPNTYISKGSVSVETVLLRQ